MVGDTLTSKTLTDLMDEVKRARRKFPSPDGLTAALLEEVGEWAAEAGANARRELLQVACVALRLYEEYDSLEDSPVMREVMHYAAGLEYRARATLRTLCGEAAAARSNGT